LNPHLVDTNSDYNSDKSNGSGEGTYMAKKRTGIAGSAEQKDVNMQPVNEEGNGAVSGLDFGMENQL
jgi:hypothetical protein